MMNTHIRRLTLAGILLLASPVWSSALFEDTAANLWLVDTDSGQVTSYSLGKWLESYQSVGSQFTLPSGFQALVNQLPNSSVPMSAAQPGVSVIGLSVAENTLGEDEGAALLKVTPASGLYSETIGVSMLVEPRQLDGGERSLWWRINGGNWQNRTLTERDQDAAGRGYVEQPLYVIRDGVHRLDVELRDGASVLATEARRYEMASLHEDGELRDTDGDGLPDLVEQAIGLNPLTGDLDEPSHLDDWTRFDLWLRCKLDEQETLSDCTEPLDTDGDGWTDVDEQWRGTRHDDHQVTTFDVAPEPDSEEERQLIRHYKEFPSARRLYEIEYRLNGGPMALVPDKLTAATLYGAAGWQLEGLVSQADLDNAFLTEADVAPGRLQTSAEQALASGDWPGMRLPAGDAVLLRAGLTEPVTGGTARKESLVYLSPRQDLTPRAFKVEDFGTWSTAEEWKAHYHSWLENELVQSVSPQFSEAETRALLAFEFLLTREARLREISTSFKLGAPGEPLAWLRDLKAALDDRTPDTTLSQLIDGLETELQPEALLADDAAHLDTWLADLPAGSNSQGWLAQKLMFSQAGTDIGCYIDQGDWDTLNQPGNEAALQQFQDECPLHHTSTELADWERESLDRRYRLRLMLLADGAMRLANDATLAQAGNDSDSDNLTNAEEILLRPYRAHTLPWLADTDTDGYVDGSDICPLDRFNRCTGEPEENNLYLGNNLTVSKPATEGTVLLSLQLDRPAERPVTIDYQVWSGPDDNGLDGEDFIASSGQLVIQPGQTTLLVPVTLLGGGTGQQFRLEVLAVEGASVDGPDFTLIELTDYVPGTPVAKVMATNLSIEETKSLVLDASLSYDPSGSALSFDWQASPALGETLDYTSSSGFAELTAPNLAASTTQVVTVTVTNDTALSDQVDIEVLIVAEDEPPTILGMPSYQMERQGNRVIGLSELTGYVEDPEGEPVSFDAVLEQPEGVLAYLTDTDLVLEGDSVSVSAVGVYRAQNGSVVTWRDEGFAFITSSNQTEPARLYGWHPSTGLQVQYTAVPGERLSGLIYDPTLDRFYFDRDLEETTTVSWLDSGANVEGVVNNSVYSWADSRQINSRAEGLYMCTFDTQLWVYLNTQTGTVQATGETCGFSSETVQSTRQVCLQSDDRLLCTAPDSTDPTLAQPMLITGLDLLSLDAVADSLLLLTENTSSSSTNLFQYTPGFAPAELIGWPQTGLRHSLAIQGQTMTLAVGLDQLELYRWQPGETLQQFSSNYYIEPGEGLFQPTIRVTNDEVVGLVGLDATDVRVYRFDLTSEVFSTLVELNVADPGVHGYELELSPRGPIVGTVFGDGECFWQRVSEGSLLGDVYFDRSACGDRLVTPDVEVHRNYDDVEGRYFQVNGGDFTGQTLLQLGVSDEAGNGSVLPVELDVVEAP